MNIYIACELDNLEKKIHFIRNFFKEEKVKNYYKTLSDIKSEIENLISPTYAFICRIRQSNPKQ